MSIPWTASTALPGTFTGCAKGIGATFVNPPPNTNDRVVMAYIDTSSNIYVGDSADGTTWTTKNQLTDVGGAYTAIEKIGIKFNAADSQIYVAFIDTSNRINIARTNGNTYSWSKSIPAAFSAITATSGVGLAINPTTGTAWLSYLDASGGIWVSTSTNANFSVWSAPYQVSTWVANEGIGMELVNGSLIMALYKSSPANMFFGVSPSGISGSWVNYGYSTGFTMTTPVGTTVITAPGGFQTFVVSWGLYGTHAFCDLKGFSFKGPTLITSANNSIGVGIAVQGNTGTVSVVYADSTSQIYGQSAVVPPWP